MVLLSASNPRQRNAIAKRLLTPSKEGSLGGAAKKVRCTCIVTGVDYLLLIVIPTIRTISWVLCFADQLSRKVREWHLSLSLYKLKVFVTCSITELRT